MLSLEDIIGAVLGVSENIVIDGLTGFLPLLMVARLLIASGAMRDKGQGEPTRRQLQHLSRTVSRYPEQLDIRVLKDGIYVRVL